MTGVAEDGLQGASLQGKEVPSKGVTELLTAGALGFHPAGEST